MSDKYVCYRCLATPKIATIGQLSTEAHGFEAILENLSKVTIESCQTHDNQ